MRCRDARTECARRRRGLDREPPTNDGLLAAAHDLLAKRRHAGALVATHREKGTASGIAHALRFLLGLDATVVPLAADTLALGDTELGVNGACEADAVRLQPLPVEALPALPALPHHEGPA
jgi:hypothetical protein